MRLLLENRTRTCKWDVPQHLVDIHLVPALNSTTRPGPNVLNDWFLATLEQIGESPWPEQPRVGSLGAHIEDLVWLADPWITESGTWLANDGGEVSGLVWLSQWVNQHTQRRFAGEAAHLYNALRNYLNPDEFRDFDLNLTAHEQSLFLLLVANACVASDSARN